MPKAEELADRVADLLGGKRVTPYKQFDLKLVPKSVLKIYIDHSAGVPSDRNRRHFLYQWGLLQIVHQKKQPDLERRKAYRREWMRRKRQAERIASIENVEIN